jgi:hypothetical protein
MRDAVELVTRYPATLAMVQRGELSFWHALRLVEAGTNRSDAVMAAVEARVLSRSGEQSVGQFKQAIARALAAIDPQSQAQQEAATVAQRRVVFSRNASGTTDLWAPNLPAVEAAALQARVEELARSWKGADARSGDQRRADALLALALGNGVPERAAVKPTVHVVVAVSTLLDLDEQPATMNAQPIPAAVARAIAFDPTGTWRRLLTDADGRLVDVSTTGYTPPANMARLVRLRQPTCAFPGCGAQAVYCELDHVTAWAHGGATTAANLQPLCARHHHLKHEAGWHVTRAADGTTTWTSPTGRRYSRPPDQLPTDTTTRRQDDDTAA